MRPVVEGMGHSWGGQRDKLDASRSRFNRTDGADGRVREMTCIPLRRYPVGLILGKFRIARDPPSSVRRYPYCAAYRAAAYAALKAAREGTSCSSLS